MISNIALQEFKEIWKMEFGSDIPDDVAISEATNLLTMFDAIYRPIEQQDVHDYEENRQVIGESKRNRV